MVIEPPSDLLQQVFPWIEREQAALEARSVANPNARDFALKHFLALLKWLRLVLLQDMAVLSTSYPSLPILAFAPFNTASFRGFATSSAATIHRAAEEARLQLQNLPDMYAQTFRGLVASSALEQQRIFTKQSHQIRELTQTVEKLSELLDMQSASKRSRRHHRGKSSFLPGYLNALTSFSVQNVATPPASGMSAILGDCVAPTPPLAFPPVGSDALLESAVDPAESVSALAVAPVPTVMVAPALDLPSQAGNSMPPLLSPNPHIASLQQSNWDALVTRYGEQRLRRHPLWSWEGQRFLPRYTYQPVNTIREIWEEWSMGLNGFLSTRELEEGWGAKWRRNISGLKTENGWRKKVVMLINELSQKQGWSVVLALRFLQDRYGASYKSPRKFCEFLQAKSNMGHHEVIAAADRYCS